MSTEPALWRPLIGHAHYAALGLLLCGQGTVTACVETQVPDRVIHLRHWSPDDTSGKPRTPTPQNMPIGWVYAYAVPKDATIIVKPLQQGAMAPLEVLGDDAVERLRPMFKRSPSDAPVERLSATRKWVYVHAASYGKAEVQLSSPSGWNYSVVLGMVYPQPTPSGEPIPLMTRQNEPEPQFVLDADHNTLWLSATGRLDDGWKMTSGQATTLQLVRLEQLAVPEGDEPRVGIFLVGSRSMRPGTIDIQRGSGTSGPSQTFRFHIQVRPVATCG